MSLVFSHKVSHTAPASVGHRAAQRIEIHFFTGNGTDDIRPGDKHVAQAVGHDDEISQPR